MTGAKPKILLVDDSKEDRFLLVQALTEAGLDCEIAEAADGAEAERYLLHSLENGAVPHLVILDWRLPKLSGREVMEKLFAAGVTRLTRVVVLSSTLPEGDAANLRALGVWRVLEKPVDLDEFLALGRFMKELSSPESLGSALAD